MRHLRYSAVLVLHGLAFSAIRSIMYRFGGVYTKAASVNLS